jgi:hypothetical protein
MPKKRTKPITFDAMVKFFMHTYNIPTKRDVERLNERLERIERLIVATGGKKGRTSTAKTAAKTNDATASGKVLEVVQRHPGGVGIAEIQAQTGFGEKKLRNIIFRLNKLGKIKRIQRGIYQQA